MMVSELDNFKLLLKIKPQLFINKKVLIGDEEIVTSTLMLEYLNNIPYVKASLINDTGSSLL